MPGLPRLIATCLLYSVSCTAVLAQSSPEAVRDRVRTYRQQHEVDILRSFADLLSIPNVASDSDNIRANAKRISGLFEARGFRTRLLTVAGSPPAIFGELSAPGAKRTIIWYAHYDGQPVDKSQWANDPWHPILREGDERSRVVPLDSLHAPLNPEWRIYARSAGDDKAPIQALLTAIDALRENRLPIGVNLKVFFEGEEEAGSPRLDSILHQNAALLKGDVWILSDGPVNQTRRMQVFFGARGIVEAEMTLYGPLRPLHDGHYGNWAPNPAAEMANLLARMRDDDARVLIPGFYSDVRPLSATERQALRTIPEVDTQLRRTLGLAATESGGAPIFSATTRPAFNIRGIQAGHVGEQAQNAIPTEATASFDIRLVPNQDPEKMQTMVEQFILKQGYFIVRRPPDLQTRLAHPKIIKVTWGSGYPASMTSMDEPAVRSIVSAIDATVGSPVIKLPLLGGSVPMYLFTDLLKTPVIGVPIANHDNNQHGNNENLRLQNLWDGIEIFAGILTGGPADRAAKGPGFD